MSASRYLHEYLPDAGGVTGTLALSDTADTCAVVGINGQAGTMALLDTADLCAAGGTTPVIGTMAFADAADTFAMVGAGTIILPLVVKVAPFFTTDTITTAGYQLYKYIAGVMTADGAHHTSGIDAIPNITNGYQVGLTSVLLTLDADDGYRGTIVWDSGGGSPFYVADEVYIPPSLDMTQAVPTSNVAHSVGDALNAARAQGFGKWTLVGTTLTLYASDGTTAVRTFTLDSATAPTTRQ
jgi:hypothetical protein